MHLSRPKVIGSGDLAPRLAVSASQRGCLPTKRQVGHPFMRAEGRAQQTTLRHARLGPVLSMRLGHRASTSTQRLYVLAYMPVRSCVACSCT
eukprot:2074966-Pleurochrysis_carterae.AAC.1